LGSVADFKRRRKLPLIDITPNLVSAQVNQCTGFSYRDKFVFLTFMPILYPIGSHNRTKYAIIMPRNGV
jgi:hypothetical protein